MLYMANTASNHFRHELAADCLGYTPHQKEKRLLRAPLRSPAHPRIASPIAAFALMKGSLQGRGTQRGAVRDIVARNPGRSGRGTGSRVVIQGTRVDEGYTSLLPQFGMWVAIH
jgi:hypothetical protein